MPPLPEPVSYFSCLLLDDSYRVMVMGGIDQQYMVSSSTFILDTTDWRWSKGPSLQQPRKGGVAFSWNGAVVLCGGTGEGLKTLDTAEILRTNMGKWWV